MLERRDREQYFFTAETTRRLADALARFARPCTLCAPTVGAELESRGVEAATLDIDERFATLRGFRNWDLHRPAHLAERFDVILCDPPFFSVSLTRLFDALRVLSHYDFRQPVAVSYLRRREAAFLSAFESFGLHVTGFKPEYETVSTDDRNDIAFYANFGYWSV